MRTKIQSLGSLNKKLSCFEMFLDTFLRHHFKKQRSSSRIAEIEHFCFTWSFTSSEFSIVSRTKSTRFVSVLHREAGAVRTIKILSYHHGKSIGNNPKKVDKKNGKFLRRIEYQFAGEKSKQKCLVNFAKTHRKNKMKKKNELL